MSCNLVRFTGALGRLRILTTLSSALAAVAVFSTSALNAATISLGLTCSLNGLQSSGACSSGPSFGLIKLEDLTGLDAGKVKVTVDLGFAGTQNFRSLMLNYSGPATIFTDTDSSQNVVLINNGYSISPYNGKFDLGSSGGMGWDAATVGPYSTVLSGNSPLSTSDFLVLDSLSKLYAAIHIQSIGSASGGNCDGTSNPACVPGMSGPGSLKIGAPSFIVVPFNVPEPSTSRMIGLLAATICALRVRNQ
jgi:hypothetical protein